MAVNKGFGTQLREARVSQGLSFGTVSRKLRIRPDILEAIENEDLANMPPRSYSRGMIYAYANLLHLRADKIVDLYLEAVRSGDPSGSSSRRRSGSRSSEDYDSMISEPQRRRSSRYQREEPEVGSSRSSRRHSGERSSHRNDNYESRQERGRRSSSQERSERSSRSGRSSRSVEPERSPHSALEAAGGFLSGTAALVSSATNKATRKRNQDINHSIYADRNNVSMMDRFRTAAPSRQHGQMLSGGNYVGTFNNAAPKSHPPILVIVGIVVAIVLIFFAVQAISGAISGGSSSETSTNASSSSSLNISGLHDPGSAGTVEKENKVVAIAPTAAVFSYGVTADSEAYIEIYLDGSPIAAVADTISGPAKGTYDVTGTLRFVTTSPDNVSVKIDGQPAELVDDDGTGIYVCNVDFAQILEAWKQANGQ